jgi:hypothetical protein
MRLMKIKEAVSNLITHRIHFDKLSVTERRCHIEPVEISAWGIK